MKNILELSHEEAMDFFLKSEQYHGFELPEYFSFDSMLQAVKDTIGDAPYEECLSSDVDPDTLTKINVDILLNKDGRYAVRPIVLANPCLYYFLVREICCGTGWEKVLSLFSKFNVPHIASCALPVVPQKNEKFHRSTTILNWWTNMEQRSIELSLEYRYMFVSDITNCYGSVNPQVISWAFTLANTKHEQPDDSPMASSIQRYLRALQHGRNIGIPQGSALFDFVAEIILGYSDLLLHEAIEKAGINCQYEILRYRDDYRIFCNDRDTLEKLSYVLQQVLESLNFRMNPQKTRISDSIVTDAIKADKLTYIYNTPIFNKKGCDFDSFEKHLLYILLFGRKHHNSGQIKTLLGDLDNRMDEWLKPYKETTIPLNEDEKPTTKIKRRRLSGGSVRAMSAVAVQIAIENVNCSHYALLVLSRMIDSLKSNDEKIRIINMVRNKLINQPNSDYTQLWLQNMTYWYDQMKNTSPYDMPLCRIVMDETAPLWDNSWLRADLRDKLADAAIIDKKILAEVTPVITFRERRHYTEPDAIEDEEDGSIAIGEY